ncbi:S41 family peptidase [Nitrospirillum iridis]|uniref:Tail specific protease domain-containing protein n=1 Tax=Nitrospirillum iridis TaxID=765888 RepID=A0A7X0B3G3_9PROT|nr:S41 family peptidase [Nitrospirillum iridis]MBB6255019.1 hypothetical protein [Nitrospirillum iridis]
MRGRLGMGVLTALLAMAASAASAATAQDWRRAAETDLNGLHDILVANHPAMVVQKDSAPFRAWLESGRDEARKLLPGVQDEITYFDLLRFYAGGFRDSHIGTYATKHAASLGRLYDWPGFNLTWTGSAYAVVAHAPDTALPPAGAQLVACDGMSAAALSHDRQERNGKDLALDSQRRLHAFWLLWASEHSLFQPPLKTCSFASPGGGPARSYTLSYRPTTEMDSKPARAAQAHFGLNRWGRDGWWIGAPDMTSDHAWKRTLAAVKTHREAIRRARTVVVDVRGNTGGSAEFANTLADLLWGSDMVNADKPALGPVVYRATRLNRDQLAADLPQITDIGSQIGTAAKLRRRLKRYDDAIAAGQATFTEEAPARSQPLRPPPNPMRGQIIILTDGACVSACLDLMDLFLALPNVRQAGTETNADTIFMEISQATLPSGYAGMSFGHKAWVERPRGSNVSYHPTPALTWMGDPADDAGERAWLAQAMGISP